MDWIILAIVGIIVGCAVVYIVKAKKKGVRCIGCSAGGCHCNHDAPHDEEESCCCGCHDHTTEEYSEK